MVEQNKDTVRAEDMTIRRRGLIAGAAALAVGVLATRMGSDSVDAADNSMVLLGAANDANNTEATTTTITGPITITVLRAKQTGVAVPDTSLDGVQGFVTGASNSGIHGRNDALNGIGGTGVATNGTGLYGQSTSGSAVGGSSVNGAGVYAISSSGAGVYGTSSTGDGVHGVSTGGNGVYGISTNATGVLGVTTAPGFSALGGITSTPNTAAFAGTSTIATAFAGFFTGDVYVNGNFTVQDPTRKHGAIAHPDGTSRILYSMESPEPWLEDFGDGKLVNGSASVKLDADFAAVVHTDAYQVFLTEYGESNGLYVSKRSASGFVVQERNKGTASGAFAWRVVARPKTTNKAERLAKFTAPRIKLPGTKDVVQIPSLPQRKP